MSFILDALKKSEAERQRQAGPALIEMRVVGTRRRVPVWLLAAAGALALVNLVGIGWLLLRPSATAPTVAPAPTGAAVPATESISQAESIVAPAEAQAPTTETVAAAESTVAPPKETTDEAVESPS